MSLSSVQQAASRVLSRLSLGSHTFILPCHHNLGHHVVGYHVVGKPTGRPVFYFHGTPSTRLEVDNFHDVCEKLDICMVGVDRPGLGLSTFRPRFTLLDWPRTIRPLAAHLGFKQYWAAGGSGGGPYALACAHDIPQEELKGVGIISGLGPPEAPLTGLSWQRRVGFTINRYLPRWMLLYIDERWVGRPARDPDQKQWRKIITEGIAKQMVDADRDLMNDHDVERMILEMRDAFYSGSDGNVLDSKILLKKWPFDLSNIDVKVRLFNGTADTDTPIHMARWMANQLPNGQLKEYPDLTHFSLSYCRSEEIFRDLLDM